MLLVFAFIIPFVVDGKLAFADVHAFEESQQVYYKNYEEQIIDEENLKNEINVDLEIQNKDFIKWVDFKVGTELLKEIYSLDVKYHNSDIDFKFCEVLAYLSALNGNEFSKKKDSNNLKDLISKLENNEKVEDLMKDNKYYKYYLECYEAIFSAFIGEYISPSGEVEYGLKAYFPLAKSFSYHDYDDFGNSRNYGFKRKHLGHDMMGQTGTPIVAVEGGKIVEIGWNQYGGWRIGIRSHDNKRFYYYAHLRQNRPFSEGLELGDSVIAGQVIGYMGRTGYSLKENKNMDCDPHLHFGLQLIFDESQASGNGEIWIDVYPIVNLLYNNRAETERNSETKEHASINLKQDINN